jgi:hypothetical protein
MLICSSPANISTDGIKMFLAIPATSASSERVFSGAGFIFSERRRALHAEGLASLVFVRENAKDDQAFTKAFEEILKNGFQMLSYMFYLRAAQEKNLKFTSKFCLAS